MSDYVTLSTLGSQATSQAWVRQEEWKGEKTASSMAASVKLDTATARVRNPYSLLL